MSQINKSIIIPILALVALVLKQGFNVDLGDEQINVVADGILAILALIGILMNPKKSA